MFGTNNNNFVKQNVTTVLENFFSDLSKLTLSGWNEYLSIRLSPFKGTSQEGVRMYATDFTDTISTALSRDAAFALIEAIEDRIKPAIKDNIDASVGVIVGTNENKKVIQISHSNGDVKLAVNTKLGENGVSDDSNKYEFIFSKREYGSYTNSTGMTDTVTIQSEFIKFCKIINEFVNTYGTCLQIEKYKNSFKNSGGYNRFNGYQNQNQVQNQGQIEPAVTHNFSGSNLGDFLPFS